MTSVAPPSTPVARADIPGPWPAVSLFSYLVGMPQLLRYCRRRYGDIFRVQVPFLGSVVVLTDPQALRTVYSSSEATLIGPVRAWTMRDIIEDATIVTLDGEEHRRRRRLLHAPFHGRQLEGYEQMIVEAVTTEIDRWRPGDVVRIHDFALSVTTAVISRILFGNGDGARLARFAEHYRTLCKSWSWAICLPQWAKSERLVPAWRRLGDTKRELRRMFDEEIAARRNQSAEHRGGDVCSLLVEAVDEDGAKLSDTQIRDELTMLGFGGSHSSSVTIEWMFEYLMHDRALVARLESNPDDAALCDAIVQEALRIRTPHDTSPRLLVTDIDVGGVRIPAGEFVTHSNDALHRRGDLYERPDEFTPDRFLERGPRPFEWLPFGGGPRRCLGASLAQLEIRIVLREVFKRWHLRPVRRRVARPRRSGVLWVPSRGVPVTVTGPVSSLAEERLENPLHARSA